VTIVQHPLSATSGHQKVLTNSIQFIKNVIVWRAVIISKVVVGELVAALDIPSCHQGIPVIEKRLSHFVQVPARIDIERCTCRGGVVRGQVWLV